MKVVYVLRYYPTLTETFVAREAAELLRRGVDVEAVAWGTRSDGVLQNEAPTWNVVRPPSGRRALELGRGLRFVGKTAGLLAGFRPKDALRVLWLADHLQRVGADRVHVHFAGEAAEWTRAACRLAGVPYSVTVHAVDLFKPRQNLLLVLRDAATVVTVSAFHRAHLEKMGIDAFVVRCGVPLDVAQADLAAPGPLRIIAVGRDVPKKGLDLLLEALEQLPDATLHLVSDRKIAHPRITAGLLSPSNVREALAHAHVFALPCRVAPDGDSDGLPVALLEAMAAGLPVVSTPVAGIPEVVDASVGWLIPVNDVSALVLALHAAASLPERIRRGTAARERIQGWTVGAQVDGLLAAWAAS